MKTKNTGLYVCEVLCSLCRRFTDRVHINETNSGFFSAEISGRSPQKLIIFIL